MSRVSEKLDRERRRALERVLELFRENAEERLETQKCLYEHEDENARVRHFLSVSRFLSDADRTEVRLGLCALGAKLLLGEDRYGDRTEDADDRNNNQHFDQSESRTGCMSDKSVFHIRSIIDVTRRRLE